MNANDLQAIRQHLEETDSYKIRLLSFPVYDSDHVLFSDGVWLYNKEILIDKQKNWDDDFAGKNIDFSKSDFWVGSSIGIFEPVSTLEEVYAIFPDSRPRPSDFEIDFNDEDGSCY